MDTKNLPIDSNTQGLVRLSRRRSLAPCDKRVIDLVEELKAVRRKEPSLYWTTLAERAKKDLWIYLRLVLDYRFLDPWDHGEEVVPFIQSCVDENHPFLLLAPRGAAKTGLVTVPLMPWLIARDPTITTIITNVREEKAAHFARLAATIIQASPNYRACFPDVTPSDKWGEGGYVLSLKSRGGLAGRTDPTIASYGVGGNIVGAHVRAIIHDDLINDKTYLSPVEREKARAFLVESLNCLDPGGLFAVCATRWHYDDVYGKLESGDVVVDGKRARVFKRGAERYVLDDDGNPVVEIFNPRRTYVDINGQKQQVGYTAKELEGKKLTLGPLYSALYMNNPVSDADRLIAVENINQFVTFNLPLGPLARVGIEIVSQAEAFWQSVMTAMRDQGKMFSVQKLRPKATRLGVEKHARIRAVIGPLAAAGKLWIRDDLWARDGNIGEELRQFDRGSDDLLDALTYAIIGAPKWSEHSPPLPYIAVDPAFTTNEASNSTAILVGCWVREDFYVLDARRFKVAKTELLIDQIFKMADKYLEGGEALMARAGADTAGGFCSPGNGRAARKTPQVTWGPARNLDTIGDGVDGKSQERQNYRSRRPQVRAWGFRH